MPRKGKQNGHFCVDHPSIEASLSPEWHARLFIILDLSRVVISTKQQEQHQQQQQQEQCDQQQEQQQQHVQNNFSISVRLRSRKCFSVA